MESEAQGIGIQLDYNSFSYDCTNANIHFFSIVQLFFSQKKARLTAGLGG